MSNPPALWLPILGILGLLAEPERAPAGWLCIRNDTSLPLVIQQVQERPIRKRVKLMKLLPGEVYREYQPAPGPRQVQVFDARSPMNPLWVGRLTWTGPGDLTLRLEEGENVIRLTPHEPKKLSRPGVVLAGSVAERR